MNKISEFKIERPSMLSVIPFVLVRDVLKKWLLILTVAVMAGVGAYIITDWTYKPVYQTSSTLVVTTRDSSNTVYSNLQSTTELASVFAGLLNSSVLQKVVLEEDGLDTRVCRITVSPIEETNLLTIQVTASDPLTSFRVLRSLIDNHGVVTYKVIGDIVVEVLQLPRVSTAPANSPNMVKWVLAAMVLAAIAACAGITTFSLFRNTVRSKSEAEYKLDCWCLGEIYHERKYKTLSDWTRRRKNRLIITNPSNSFRFLETIRRIRRRIEQYMGESKVLMITSVMENEGKSTTAVNLAMSLAQKHSRVLLIDFDLYKPSCHRILGAKDFRYGVSDVLTGKAEFLQAVIREPLSGLHLMPERMPLRSGNTQSVSSIPPERISALLERAREEYDYVVLDLPPMAAVTDVEYMIEHADASLLVVKQNQVGAEALNRAIATLQKGKAELLGCVLNNVYSMHLVPGHESNYGYGYDKYGSYGKYKGTSVFSQAKSGDSGR